MRVNLNSMLQNFCDKEIDKSMFYQQADYQVEISNVNPSLGILYGESKLQSTTNDNFYQTNDMEIGTVSSEDAPLLSYLYSDREIISENFYNNSDIEFEGHYKIDLDVEALFRPKEKPIPPSIKKDLFAYKMNKDIVEITRFLLSQLKFMYYKGDLYIYEHAYWERIDKHMFSVKVQKCLSESCEFTDVLTTTEYNKLYTQIKISPDIQQMTDFKIHYDLLNLIDGTLHIPTMRLQKHNPDDGFFSYLNMSFNEMKYSCGNTFERFVKQVSCDNPDVRTQILELISIIITGLEVKSFFVALGPSGTGKTQLGRFLAELIGDNHVVTLGGMNDFADKFALGRIENKMLITCLDLPNTPLPPAAIGMLKQLVGDDPVKSERKFQDPETVYHKPVFFCAGNYPIMLPSIAREDALLRRMVVIPFLGRCSENEAIPQLYRELLKEAPYIVKESLFAYQNLIKNGCKPTTTEVPIEYKVIDSRVDYNNVFEFVKCYCMLDEETETSTYDLYQSYKSFVFNFNLSDLSLIEFSKLFAEVMSIQNQKVFKVKRVNGSEKRGYRGICTLDMQELYKKNL